MRIHYGIKNSPPLSYRKMDHLNLCKFIGAIVKDPNNLAIISEYCPKGSLNDVLQNEDIPLNWGFRFSFATDIARGMAYLHSKRVCHGRLTSSNCVIDDRWVVKISGGWNSSLTHKGSGLFVLCGGVLGKVLDNEKCD